MRNWAFKRFGMWQSCAGHWQPHPPPSLLPHGFSSPCLEAQKPQRLVSELLACTCSEFSSWAQLYVPRPSCIGDAMNLDHGSMKFCYLIVPQMFYVMPRLQIEDSKDMKKKDSVTKPCEKESLTHVQKRTIHCSLVSVRTLEMLASVASVMRLVKAGCRCCWSIYTVFHSGHDCLPGRSLINTVPRTVW